MTHRAALLELERKKLTLLRNKLAEQERRVKTLEAMEDDPLDALLERELAGTQPRPAAATGTERSSAIEATAGADATIPEQAKTSGLQPELVEAASMPYAWQRRPRRIPPMWVKLLRFIGPEGKTYEQVVEHIARERLQLTGGAARTQLMHYRKEFGLIENPARGFYVATDKALQLIAAQEGESPAVGDGGALKTQPTPLTRAAA